jgi:DNA-binding response OmpR family regulator
MERILVIEDDGAVRRVLKRLFESEGYSVQLTADGISGLEAFRKNPPSALILDLRLPGIAGQEVCREITRIAPRLPILVLSADTEVLDKVLLLEMGASDYLTKPFSPRELLARVRAAWRTSAPLHVPDIFVFDDVTVNFSKREAIHSGISVLLTEKECETLKFMIQNAERVISREELLNKVWCYESHLHTRTVDQHILHLRTKLEKDPSRPVHFRTIRRAGYKFVP